MPRWLDRWRIGRDSTPATHANTPQRVGWEADVERTVSIYHGRPASSPGRPVIDARTAGSDPDSAAWAAMSALTVEPALVGAAPDHVLSFDPTADHMASPTRGPEHWWNVRDAETGVLVETRLYERPDRPPVREASMVHAFVLRPFDQWTTQTFPGYKTPEDTGASIPRGRNTAFGLPQRNTQRQQPAPWDALLTTAQSAPSGFGEV